MAQQACKDYRGVAEVRFDVVQGTNGTFLLNVWHRHYGGEWSYWRDQYAHLTTGEVTDIVEAELEGIGFRHLWLHGEQQSLL